MTHALRTPRTLVLAVATALAVLALLGPGSAPTLGQDAPGINGTVKIHEGATHEDPPPTDRNNEPQVCTFHVHGFGFDTTSAGNWRIYTWPPTGDMTLVASGSFTGEEWQSAVMSLADGHYRLVVDVFGDANDARDDDTTADKHKEFWIECPVVTPSPEGSVEASESVAPTPTPTPAGSVEATESLVPTPSPTPAGSVEAIETLVPLESPEGSVLAVEDVPPTDTVAPASAPAPSTWRFVLLTLAAGLATLGLSMRPAPRSARR